MKIKFPRDEAMAVARDLIKRLEACCEPKDGLQTWLTVAGSLRRRKDLVSDIELVYAPKTGPVQDGLFVKEGNVFDAQLELMICDRIIAMRPNVNGGFAWGPSNKLAVHCASGIPVDFFATKIPHFWNYLVCRTGGKESNMQIAVAAQKRGLKWTPYHSGFEVTDAVNANAALNRDDLRCGSHVVVQCERDVFAFVGLPYLEPKERE